MTAPSFREAIAVWAKIGLLSFGGPAGQIALMHRILIEEKKWIDEPRFLHALNFCMLLPGPEAQQLATYLGWLLHKTWGGVVAGVLFILPGSVVILALSILYVSYADLSLVSGALFGVKAAVIAIVIEAVIRVSKRALKNRAMIAVAAASFVAIFFFAAPFPAIVVSAGFLGFLGARCLPQVFKASPILGAAPGAAVSVPKPDGALRAAGVFVLLWMAPILALIAVLGPDHVYAREAVFFSKMAVVTFGGAYAVLAYVAQQAVEAHAWLAPGEMIDGLGLAETTPGPLVLVLQFVGFLAGYRAETGLPPLAAGALGAAIATWVTFAPCFLWIFLGAPFIERMRNVAALSSALSTITAAVVGVILNLAIWFAAHVIFQNVRAVVIGPLKTIAPDLATLDPYALALAGAAIILMLRFKSGLLPVLAASAVAGAIISAVRGF